ncbi:unnamed protein product [Brugia pahangi]|uniref:HTH La-type RNA-binding domain-containing protein n=1 Tax=Brugia pahangi TaxID=6280 RepID=A0A0N4SXP9_BRUPA|nr:unnamed protein product [Brugia pahangi]
MFNCGRRKFIDMRSEQVKSFADEVRRLCYALRFRTNNSQLYTGWTVPDVQELMRKKGTEKDTEEERRTLTPFSILFKTTFVCLSLYSFDQ